MVDKIKEFQGQFRWLSNFSPCRVELDGVTYPTVEHAYQAAKTIVTVQRENIAAAPTPGVAKRMGRRIVMRRDWTNMRVDVMRELLRQKFSDPTYADLLEKTGEAVIEEGNAWGDTFWGVCRGKGENVLGRLVMEIRAERRENR